MSWERDPTPWHTVVLGGETLPGIWTAQMTNGIARQIEVKKPRGNDGQEITDQGMVGPEVVLEGSLLSEEWDAWVALVPKINPRKPGGIKSPQSVVHPLLNAHGIDKIYVHTLRPFNPDPRDNFMRIELHAVQWFPQPKKTNSKKKVDGANKPGPSRYGTPFTAPGDPSVPDAVQDSWGEPMSVSPDYVGQSIEPIWTPL